MKVKRLISLTALFLLSTMCFGAFSVAASAGSASSPDIDRNGTVSEEDAKILLRQLSVCGDDSLPRSSTVANDINEDGVFSIMDVTAVLQQLDAPETEAEAETPSSSVSLRVGTYNIQNGGRVGHDFSILAQDILDQGLDVVGLQEVDMFTSRNGGKDTMAALAKATGYEYYGFTKCINLSGVSGVNGGVGEYGIAILSRYPILSYESIMLPRISGEQRGCAHAVIEVDGVQFDFYNVHLDWPNKADRTEQFKVLSAIMANDQNAIILGDLNTEDAAEYRVPFPYCSFANGLKGDDNYYITNHEDGAIDNIIISSANVTMTKVQLVDTTSNNHSDHNMLWADVEISREDAFREADGNVYYYRDGVKQTGWQVYGKSIFYFDPETGAMATEPMTLGGQSFTFESFELYGMTMHALAADCPPPKTLLPQQWLAWLLSNEGPTDKALSNGLPYTVRYTADGKEHNPSAFALSLNNYYFQYQLDSAELDASGKGYTFEIWYKDADKKESYKSISTIAVRTATLSNGNILYRLPVYNQGMNDLVTNSNGRTNTYDMVLVVYDANGTIAGFKQMSVDFTDSSALFLADALEKGIVG
ncbi:MAG: endonuclease/exonuclease/phosphatase family protein [Clostridia bacterium]|nr:endonuclease/exonuclease/phosphatase family protein [Clostridia bacterium]